MSALAVLAALALVAITGCTDTGAKATPEETAAVEELANREAGFRRNKYGRVMVADLGNAFVEDKDLALLRHFDRMEELILSGTDVTNAGLEYVKPLDRLKRLGLANTAVGDEGLAALTDLPLEELDLENTKITDAGLEHLAEIDTLRRVYVRGTGVTFSGKQALEKQLPALDVTLE